MLALVLAYPLGLVYVAGGSLGRAVITFLILLPLLTSTVVRTFAWIVILGREGIVNSTMLALGPLGIAGAAPVHLERAGGRADADPASADGVSGHQQSAAARSAT